MNYFIKLIYIVLIVISSSVFHNFSFSIGSRSSVPITHLNPYAILSLFRFYNFPTLFRIQIRMDESNEFSSFQQIHDSFPFYREIMKIILIHEILIFK